MAVEIKGVKKAYVDEQISQVKEDLTANIEQAINDYFRENPVSGVTPEQISSAVNSYLTQHPVQGDGDTTYSFSLSGNVLTITPSSGSPIVLTLPSGGSGGQGADGLSAYQIALNNGFVGTESQWLASLKGAKGDTGARGANGSNYVITSADYTNIANVVLGLIPNGNEVAYGS